MKRAFIFLLAILTAHTAFAQCDTLTNTTAADTVNIYSASGGGYTTGHNAFGDISKAEFFQNNVPGKTITEVILGFGIANQGTNSNSIITINIWNSDGLLGAPGTILGTTTIPMQQVVADVNNSRFTTVTFNTPVLVNSDFYVGVELDYSSSDSIAILHTQDRGTGQLNTAWEQFSNGDWFAFDDFTGSWGFSLSQYIFVGYCDTTFVANIPAVPAITCTDSFQIVSTIYNGSGNYQFTWTPSTGLSCTSCQNPWVTTAGNTYSLEVIDLTNNDTATATFIANFYPALLVSLPDSAFICNNSTIVSANPLGGSAPYTFMWSNGATAPNTSINSIGAYSLTVTDANGCTEIDQFTTYIRNPILATVTSQRPLCSANNGFIDVTVTTGTPPYSYELNGLPVSFPINNLNPGNYNIHITDADTSSCPFDTTLVFIDSCGFASGVVFDDMNGNGIQDAGELGLPGINILTTPAAGSAVTNLNGAYEISFTAAGNFTLSASSPPDVWLCSGNALVPFTQTLPAGGNGHAITVSTASAPITGLNFGFMEPTNPCGTISGKVFNDLNSNGVQEAGEQGLSGIQVKTNYGNATITNFSGDYTLEVLIDTPTVVSVQLSTATNYYCYTNPVLVAITPVSGSYNVTLTAASPTAVNKNFSLGYSTSNNYDVSIMTLVAYSGNRPGQTFTAWSDIKRTYGTNTDCCYRINFNPAYTFNYATITPTTVTNTYIEWCWPAGDPFNYVCMAMNFTLNSNAVPGTVYLWTGAWTCDVPDNCTYNDSIATTVTVNGVQKRSLLPDYNQLLVYNQSRQYTYALAQTDTTFSYEIGWQNTSADTAYSITIIDTLSEHLDINTLSTPFSSLPYELYIVDDHILIWNIESVVVPDSASNFSRSYGFVQYNIEAKNNLPDGTLVKNKASVRFNYGDFFETNEVENRIGVTGIKNAAPLDLGVSIYPNPNNGQFTIDVDAELQVSSISIYNTVGSEVLKLAEHDLQVGINNIEFNNQPNGLYLVRIQTNKGLVVKRIVVSK